MYIYICIHIYTHCVYIYVITLDYLVLHTPLELKKTKQNKYKALIYMHELM